MIDFFTTICIVSGLCILRIVFLDGFENGCMIIVFLLSYVGLPLYFMIKLDHVFGILVGFVVATLIVFTLGDVFDKHKTDDWSK